MEAIALIPLLMVYWVVRGLVGLFRRHNAIVVVLYVVILFPIAWIHMFILGAFGKSKKGLLKAEVEREAQKQVMLEKAIEKKLGKDKRAMLKGPAKEKSN